MGMDTGAKKGPRSDINITPLVDIVLVLLIIFMVLTPLMEKELSVRVPEDIETTEPPPPPDPDIVQFVFRVDEAGKFFVNNEELTEATAQDTLKKYYRVAKAQESKAGPPVIFFEAADKAKYARAVQGLDMIRDSTKDLSVGWTIGMMTEKLAQQNQGGEAPGTPAPPAPAPATPQ